MRLFGANISRQFMSKMQNLIMSKMTEVTLVNTLVGLASEEVLIGLILVGLCRGQFGAWANMFNLLFEQSSQMQGKVKAELWHCFNDVSATRMQNVQIS